MPAPAGSSEDPRDTGRSLPSDERTAGDTDQTLSDIDQTVAETEQTLADADQTASDQDQTDADSDQAAADEDQAASDRDLASGTDPKTYERSRDVRERTTRHRKRTGKSRTEDASRRDETAQARDLAAAARDQAADSRDRVMADLDAGVERDLRRPQTGAGVRSRAADQRWRSATYRAAAAAQRAQAAEDRRAAAEDRRLAADERAQAHADLNDMARELEIAATDPLTGARMRAAGLAELDHEIDRARRAGASLVAVYVDVVGLKAVNDSEGHLAGDTMLQRVVAVLKENVRSYDLIIRLGGDEFLCVLSDATLMDARRRLRHVGITLAADETPHQVTAGFAKLGPGETAAELIARADADLIDQRGAAH